jgi:hypothetical protein
MGTQHHVTTAPAAVILSLAGGGRWSADAWFDSQRFRSGRRVD